MSGSFYREQPTARQLQRVLPARAVLCVQPKTKNQQFLEHALEAFSLVFAGNAFEAIRCSNRSAFDAYVLDCWLPDWTGSGLCREIRKSDPNVPIIFYTLTGDEHAPRALRAGATAYLHAPLDGGALRERLRLLIEAADIRDLRARLEVERVLHDELERTSATIDSAEQPMCPAADWIERMAKLKAIKAFIAAGGTRAGFQRFWPHEFAAACARERQT
ncbi:MAG: response regulator with CheY-like receiver domain and winged-helix DNA-binding domain [Betaproteobacteria bacterium]|jgi:DNA-binding response OmpR family regulator|nr:response regulator with CheY-like receiver domain and winged-helix DNA-binding domain [Betaproteobacteria bacterium]MEA3152536.1 two-component system, OmpR family, response regulator RegX3 [Betaproteobacteria bacterium]